MRRFWMTVLTLAVAVAMPGNAGAAFPQMAGRADAGYDTLLKLFTEFRAFQKPGISVEGAPDYSSAAMAAQKAHLPEFQKRLAAISTRSWPMAQRVDYEAPQPRNSILLLPGRTKLEGYEDWLA